MNPLVSVIVPTYDGEAFVRATIESVLAQSYSPVEVIVSDDGSTDGTLPIVESFGARVRVLRGENRGVSAARNAGAAIAKGELLAFLDHDDLWEPELLATLVPLLLARAECGFAYADSWVIDADGRVRGRRSEFLRYAHDRVFEALLEQNFVPIETLLLRAKLFRDIGGFDVSLRYIEDFELCLRAARRTCAALYAEPLARYRIHDRNLSHDLEPMLAEWLRVFEELPARFPDLSAAERERVAYQRARYALDLAWRALRRGDLGAADEWTARAGAGGPRWTRARVRALRALLAVLPRSARTKLLAFLPRRKLYGVHVAGAHPLDAERGSRGEPSR